MQLYTVIGLICAVLCSVLRSRARDEFLVPKLPGLHENIQDDDIPLMFAGQLELYKENDTHLFFWKYLDNNVIPEYKKRTIFWLNGGPGCSSMDGALMEAGPFRINDQKQVVKNSGSWHKAGDIVFVDQPAGTGFSYTKEYDHDLDQIVWQFLRFMERFYELFPEDIDNEIYFAGESYAGQYIPYIADGILKRNKNLKQGQARYNLKGLLIGNGWIAPNTQSLSYLPYSMKAGIIDSSNEDWNDILRQHEKCQNIVNSVDDNTMSDSEVVADTCETILNKILRATLEGTDQQCYNMYDYTLKDSYPSCGMNWPPDLANVGPFLNSKNVQSDLNLVLHKKWHECSGKVGGRFNAKHSAPAVKLLPGILEEIPIVLFNGNRDIICNYIGTENFIKELQWNGAKGFLESSPQYEWIYDKEVAGYIKTERNLTFVNVFDASHMVPFDKPEVSRSLIDILTGNFDVEDKSIITKPLGVRKISEPASASAAASSSASATTTPVDTLIIGGFTQFALPSTAGASSGTSTASSEASSGASGDDAGDNTSRITRIIQLVVLVIIIWGFYMLYSHYKSRPASIIKTRPSGKGKKKNVQWADQLRQFQEDDDIQQQSFISKALNKIRGTDNGTYAPANTDYVEDIEMGEDLPREVEDFVIDSEEEDNKDTV